MTLTVGGLKAILATMNDDDKVVFDDDNTEYIYGLSVQSVGQDHIALTWDEDEMYIIDDNSSLVEP